jgi:hypothetical protein
LIWKEAVAASLFRHHFSHFGPTYLGGVVDILKGNSDNKWMWALPLGVLLVILLSFATYQWIIPRTDLEVRTVYHEAPGGGGTGGTININVLFTNLGNRDVSSLECDVTVTIKGDGVVTRHSSGPETLSMDDNVEIKITHIGSHYVTYLIDLDISFECSGDSYSNTMNYETIEDTMNLVFVENLK